MLLRFEIAHAILHVKVFMKIAVWSLDLRQKKQERRNLSLLRRDIRSVHAMHLRRLRLHIGELLWRPVCVLCCNVQVIQLLQCLKNREKKDAKFLYRNRILSTT